jgi:hypothetical protein
MVPHVGVPSTRSINLRPYSYWSLKQFGFHIDFAELCDTATQLEKCLDALQYPHMGESNFLDKLELRVFRQNWNAFGHFEHSADDIVRRITKIPIKTVSSNSFQPSYRDMSAAQRH